MLDKKLHIVSFNVPYPANYGGVIDVFYKLKALHDEGVSVILHCFDYGRGKSEAMESLCSKVFYYPRKKGFYNLFSHKPYIVISRSDENLLRNILAVEAPVLFEGIHCTAILKALKEKNFKVYVRCHNNEVEYYKGISFFESNFLKKQYYKIESRKISSYETILGYAEALFPISISDIPHYKKLNSQSVYLPPFHPYQEVLVKKEMGEYALFHGNLSVSENDYIAYWLCESVFSKINIPFYIAGNDISRRLARIASQMPNVKLFDPTASEMAHLIENAQLHLLPSFIKTGIKLKLLTSLFRGRHCLPNNTTIDGTGLENLVCTSNTAEEFIQNIQIHFAKNLNEESIEKRKNILEQQFSNKKNINILIEKIF